MNFESAEDIRSLNVVKFEYEFHHIPNAVIIFPDKLF